MTTLRKAKTQDLPTLYEFEQGVITAERPFDPFLKDNPISYYDIKDLIESQLSEVIIAETDEKIIGVGYVQIRESKPYWKEKHFGYLGFMYVHPRFRGKGVNKIIIDHLKDWARSKNVTELRLDVYAENTKAIRAYEKAGFKEHMLEMRLNLDDI